MSLASPSRPPVADAAARARAAETIWRLTALALAHPVPEFREAVASGDFHAAFSGAWGAVTGRDWPRDAPPAPFPDFEAGYIAAFLHGRTGKPVASLLAGDHEDLLRGLSRPSFMLNVAAFYGHFKLKAATGDEGRADEPDHLSAMAEFMAVLSHLEARTLARGADAGPPRRAMRDFLARYLAPALESVAERLRHRPVPELDPTIARVLAETGPWARQQVGALEARVGPFRDPEAPHPAAAEPAPQNLWG